MTFDIMNEEIFNRDFDVLEVTEKINNLMVKWSVHLLNMNGFKWEIKNHEGKILKRFIFNIDFEDIEARIKIEDLRLNVIHFIENLKDDTSYIDNILNFTN